MQYEKKKRKTHFFFIIHACNINCGHKMKITLLLHFILGTSIFHSLHFK
jgi:hypothetical protein